MRILVTGGAGFIGSHTCVELIEAGHEIVVVDNLVNGHEQALSAIGKLTGRSVKFYRADLLDKASLAGAFAEKIDAVIHFAAFKAVGESVSNPLSYYRNNVVGTANLLEIMERFDCKTLVYSSSCTVYGNPTEVPITEEHAITTAESPYGWSKLMTEQIMRDLFASDPEWRISLLRYFNPIGAHPSGELGEDPSGIPNNLLPYITQVAIGHREKLSVFGNDYPTPDGTPIRDYVHVVDVAHAHLLAVEQLAAQGGLTTYNLGTGTGSSVLDVIHAFETATGASIPYEIAPRRAGDVTVAYADPSKAEQHLGWRAEYTLEQMCSDAWRWQRRYPNGFRGRVGDDRWKPSDLRAVGA